MQADCHTDFPICRGHQQRLPGEGRGAEKGKGNKLVASDSSGNVCRASVGIQNEMLGGQRRAREYIIRQEGTAHGQPTPCAQSRAAGSTQPGGSEGLQKRSIRGWDFSTVTPFWARETPENLKRRLQSGEEGE